MVVVWQRVGRRKSPRKQFILLHTGDLSYAYQAILTSSGAEAQEVRRYYNKRSCSENFVKEGIYGFGLERVASHNYTGSAAGSSS